MSETFNTDWNRERIHASMRWFGPDDEVSIQNIRQAPGVSHVIAALHHIPVGEVWTEEEVAREPSSRFLSPTPKRHLRSTAMMIPTTDQQRHSPTFKTR